MEICATNQAALRGSASAEGGQGSPPFLLFRLWVLTATLALGLAGCATTPKVQTEAKPGVDFSRYHTFALLPLPTAVPGADPGEALRLAGPARQAVSESLTAKGFKEAERGQADMVVNLRGQALPKVEVTEWGYSRTAITRQGAIPVRVGDVEVRNYQERTLIVEIFDNRTKDLAWTGWSTRKTSGAIDVEKVRQTIRAVLDAFPSTESAPSSNR